MTETSLYEWLWKPIDGPFGSSLSLMIPIVGAIASIWFGLIIPRRIGTRGLAFATVAKGVLLLGYIGIGIPPAPWRFLMIAVVVLVDFYAFKVSVRVKNLMDEIVALRGELARHEIRPPILVEHPSPPANRNVGQPRRA